MGSFPRLQGRWAFCPDSLIGGKAGPPVVLRMATWWQPQPTLLPSQPAPSPSGFFRAVRGPSLSQTSCLRLSLVLEMGSTCTQRHTKNFHGCLVCQGCPVRVQRPWEGGTSTRSSQTWQEAGNIFGDYCGQETPVDIYQLLVVKHSLSTLALLEEGPAF